MVHTQISDALLGHDEYIRNTNESFNSKPNSPSIIGLYGWGTMTF